jgi:NADPH:quinone reductase-like Zn-dependent oxidoreductase
MSSSTTTMRAIAQDEYGSADVLHMTQLPRPEAAANEVLLQVRAAGLDRGTWHLMAGLPYLMRPVVGFRRPRNPVPGLDVAGVVAAVGPGVTRFAVGDEVYGFGKGTFAEYAVARADHLAPKPQNLSFEQAAVVPVSACTALVALSQVADVQPRQQVLVIGASGGVGSYAVQLAKAFGVEVTGVCSPAKVDLVRSLGAQRVLDYTRDDWADGSHHYDLVLDIGGRPTLSRLRRALTPDGTAVLVGGEDGGNLTGGMNRQLRAVALSPFVKQRLKTFVAGQKTSDLEQLTGFIEAGQVTPSTDQAYPLDQAPEAMRRLEAGEVRGKIAITV